MLVSGVERQVALAYAKEVKQYGPDLYVSSFAAPESSFSHSNLQMPN